MAAGGACEKEAQVRPGEKPPDVRCRGGHLSFHSRPPLASLGRSDGAWHGLPGVPPAPLCLLYDSAEPHAEQVVSHCPVNTPFCPGAFASAGPSPRGCTFASANRARHRGSVQRRLPQEAFAAPRPHQQLFLCSRGAGCLRCCA